MTDAGNDTADSMLVAFDRWLIPVENLFNLIAGLFIFGLMILGIFQVIGRQVFNIPVAGYIDWVEVSMAVFAFMGAAYCQRTGTHVRMELFLTKVGLRTRWSMEIMGTVGAMIIISVLIVYGYDHTMRAFQLVTARLMPNCQCGHPRRSFQSPFRCYGSDCWSSFWAS